MGGQCPLIQPWICRACKLLESVSDPLHTTYTETTATTAARTERAKATTTHSFTPQLGQEDQKDGREPEPLHVCNQVA